jgi:hypothetical protein
VRRSILNRGAVAAAAAVVVPLLLVAGIAPAHASSGPSRSVRNASISGNWAGYVDVPAAGQKVTAVSGHWIVPNAGTLPPGVSSTWTGIGGFGTQDLIQAGTQQTSLPFSVILAGGSYGAWYELLPAAPVFFTGCNPLPACPVNPGDSMSVSISNAGGSSWTISMTDAGHWAYTTSVPYASSQSSAEWIHEAPSLLGAVPIPVGGSGTVTFDGGNSFTTGAGTSPIGSGATAVEALPVETTTSAVDGDLDGFNVCTWAISCSPSPS